jgi:hypothetical protein
MKWGAGESERDGERRGLGGVRGEESEDKVLEENKIGGTSHYTYI